MNWSVDWMVEGCTHMHVGQVLRMFSHVGAQVVRRIDVPVRDVKWSESGTLLAIISEASFYILRYDQGTVDSWFESGREIDEDGIEDAFELITEVSERVRTGTPCAEDGIWLCYMSHATSGVYHRGICKPARNGVVTGRKRREQSPINTLNCFTHPRMLLKCSRSSKNASRVRGISQQ